MLFGRYTYIVCNSNVIYVKLLMILLRTLNNQLQIL